MKYVVLAGWDDAPHLTKAQKDALYSSIPIHQREARAKGIPALGSGMVYPEAEESIRVTDFPLPPHWPRFYAFDTGWNYNSVCWFAYNKESDILYIYATYKRSKTEPPLIAAAIQARGKWIPGIADASDVKRDDGKQYIQIYKDLGLDIELPNKALETGIQQTWIRLSTGKLKVFASCTEWFDEFRTYQRNEKGEIPEQTDTIRRELMDCSRYGVMSGIRIAKIEPKSVMPQFSIYNDPGFGDNSWMG